MVTPRVNEEIFLNQHSLEKNSETITQVKTTTGRKNYLYFFWFVCCVFFFLILASIESNDILITIDLHNIFSFW